MEQSLGELACLFARGKKTYNAYLSHGQQFLYARILKDNNERIRATLIKISFQLPEQLFSQCINLIHHIDVWLELWVDLSERMSPNIEDSFVFENNVNYPVEAEKGLMALMSELRNKEL